MSLSFKEKYSYGIGALGKDLVCGLVFTYLMYYFTDVLTLAPAFVGGLFFVARVWDAVNDPIMGVIVDNTRTKWGKFRPWLLIGTLINSIVFILLFKNVGLTGTGLYVYISVMYILWGMTYTIMDIPYWSMIPNLTSDKAEREKVSVIPRIFASAGGLIIGAFGLQIVGVLGGEDQGRGFYLFAIGISVVFIVTIGITVANVKEKTVAINSEKINLKQAIKLIVKNDQLIAVIGTILAFNMAMQISGGFSLYYFKYVTGNENLFSVFTMFAGLAEIGGLILFPKFVQLLSRTKVYTIACGLPVVGFLLLLISGFVLPQNSMLVALSGLILKLGSGFALGISTVILADVVDYGEFKFGTRNESVIFSVQTLLVKIAAAVSGLLTGVGLSIAGYVPNIPQSESTLNGIRFLMIAIPIILVMMSLFIYKKFFKINGAYHDEILKTLENRRLKEEKVEEELEEEVAVEDGVII